jgi:hypothetical protein
LGQYPNGGIMKKLVIGILALVSMSSFAFHPEDTDLVRNIGIGTKLKVLKDINIKPNDWSISLGENCVLSMKKGEPFDRVLSKSKVLTITKLVLDRYFQANRFETVNRVGLMIDNVNIDAIVCDRETTIGDFKRETEKYFEVTLADPKEI